MYAAYKAAVEHKGSPTVILARTIKGYGLGEAGEGRNVTHQQKKVDEDTLRNFGERFGLSFTEEQFAEVPFYRPPDDSPEMQYLRACREKLGGYMPRRSVRSKPLAGNRSELFEEFLTGSEGREVSTTMAFVGMLRKMLRDAEIGKLIVPIVPDEARTFGMESLFRLVGIYSSQGQLYEPVDMNTLLYYKEAKDGQILEEGITEAGSMSSFIAAGSAYATHGINTIPFFIFYSMFGLQRVCDLIWAAADTRCRGFLLGGTAGRTTLAGEGLQHQDGNSHVLALPIPTLQAYDPAFAFEIATIIEDGIDRMYVKGESIFYYITVMNEPYAMPPMPPGSREGILKGMYRYKAASDGKSKLRAQLFGSGSILREVLQRPGNSGGEIPRRRRRLERYELQGALQRRHRSGALESAAPNRETARAVRFSVPRRRSRCSCGRNGLSEGAPESREPVDAPAVGVARHRRIWTKREPRFPAQLL